MSAVPKPADPAADDFDLAGFLPYRLSLLSNRISGAIAAAYESEFGISMAEWRVLAVVGSFGPMSGQAVCERTEMDKVMVSRTVARLVQRKLLSQRTDGDDRRRSALTLTAKGAAIRAAIAPAAMNLERQLTGCLSAAERATLDGLLDKLLAQAQRPA